MISSFKNHIHLHFPFLRNKKLLIACSGGLDSVVLANLINTLHFEMALAHCNFSLRGKESDGDEMFVVGMAKTMEVPVFAETFDTKTFATDTGVSTQMAARTLRYQWFAEILRNFNYDFLLTAHHLDDDMETFLINLSRGSGIKGLTGIPQQNERIVRPLLPFSRDEIFAYAQKHNLKWREDSSNKHRDYLRNKLRLEVIPPFKEANPSLLKNFKKTQEHLRSSSELVQDYMVLVHNLVLLEAPDSYKIDIKKLKELPHTEALLYELLNGFGFNEWSDVFHLLEAQTGKQVFSKTHRLLKNRGELILTEIADEKTDMEFTVSEKGIDFPINLKIEETESVGNTRDDFIYVPSQKLEFPLKIRKWRDGDVFYPYGMIGKKKLSKFFKDEKIPLSEKDKIWLLTSGEKIVWVIGYRMDDRFKVDEDAEKILRIEKKG